MRLSIFPALFCPLFLVGCGLSPAPVADQPATGLALHGTVHGGQQPIANAKVYLFAANTTGYGGSGIAPSTLNASISLLTSAANTTKDTSGTATNGDYYVTSANDGSWSISNDYTCTAGQQVYLYVNGGNAGSGPNTSSGLMAVLGNCPAAGNFLAADPYVWIDEVTTIAAAYAMSGFASDALHVSSSGTALAQTGMANAFANAANLASISSGTVYNTTVGTLANILASCVNSTGPTSANCVSLFSNTPSLTSTPVTPSETATAAINIAHNPGAHVAPLFSLSSSTPPYSYALAAQPNDFTIGLSFLVATNSPLQYENPTGIAIDAAGNVWVSTYGGSVAKLTATGAIAAGHVLGGQYYPGSIAIDTAGSAWVGSIANAGYVFKFSSTDTLTSYSNGSGLTSNNAIALDAAGDAWVANSAGVLKLSSANTLLSGASGYTGGGINSPFGIAIDGSANAWVTNFGGNTVTKLSNSGTILSGTSGFSGNMSNPYGIAIDSAGNAWVTDNHTSTLTKISNTGTILSGTGYTGGGLSSPEGIAIDGAGNAWIGNYGLNGAGNSVVEFSSSGVAISGANGFTGGSTNTLAGAYGITGGSMNTPIAIAIDGSGNVWVANNSGTYGYVTELVGAATPVITPIAAGLPSTPTSNGTSNLGTRP